MISRRSAVLLIGLILLVSGCGSFDHRSWGQFQGNLTNQGFLNIKSGFALSSAWISDSYPITSSSPVIGKGLSGAETIYVGTVDAQLLALDSRDGRLLWQRRLAPRSEQFRVVSSPAVAESGAVFALASRRSGYGRLQTHLFKVDQVGFRRWSFAFPADIYAIGAPKAVTFRGRSLILVHATMISLQSAYGALYVIEDEGDRAVELEHRALSSCRQTLQKEKDTESGVLQEIESIWQVVSESGNARPDTGTGTGAAFLQPTPAVIADDYQLLIAVVDNFCGFGVYRWNGRNLESVWLQAHHYQANSSPALLPGQLMAFGRQDGLVQGFDLMTGARRWAYDAGEPVLATPAGPNEKIVFAVARNHLLRLDADTGLPLYDNGAPRRIRLGGPTYASPALTFNRVYVSSNEMLTVSHDLKTRGHDTSFRGNGLSSVAVGRDGSVYAVSADGAIHKYQGTH